MKCREYNKFLKNLKFFFNFGMKFGEDGVPLTKELVLLDSAHITQFVISRTDDTPVFGVDCKQVLSVKELYKVPQDGELTTIFNPVVEGTDNGEFVWETSGFQFRNKTFPLNEDDLRKRITFPHDAFFTIPKGVLRQKLSPYLNIGEYVLFTSTTGDNPKVAVFINDGLACAVSNIIADEMQGETFQVCVPKSELKALMKMSEGPFHVSCKTDTPIEFTWEDQGYRYSYAIAPKMVLNED